MLIKRTKSIIFGNNSRFLPVTVDYQPGARYDTLPALAESREALARVKGTFVARYAELVICVCILLLGACSDDGGSADQVGVPGSGGTGASPTIGGAADSVEATSGSGVGTGQNSSTAGSDSGSGSTIGGDSSKAGTVSNSGNALGHDSSMGTASDASIPVEQDASTDEIDTSGKRELAVTADFLNGTLSIVDVGELREGGTRSDALVGVVDVSAYSPGPLSLAITPDGKTALVSISAGFLGAFIQVPPGRGTLLFVDLESQTVTGELDVGNSPMGIAVTKDSKRAFVGLYSESYFAVVDIENRTFEPVFTGSGFNEELAIDDTGTVGILTYGPSGNVKTFSVADPAGVIGQTISLTGDAAGVAFFPGTKMAYLMQSPTILTGNVGGHNVINVEDPARPVASDDVRVPSHPAAYPVTAVSARGTVAFTSVENNTASVVEMRLDGDVASEVQRVSVGNAASLAYGLSATQDGRVLIAASGEHYIGVADLETGEAFTVPWEMTNSGPTEIKVVP